MFLLTKIGCFTVDIYFLVEKFVWVKQGKGFRIGLTYIQVKFMNTHEVNHNILSTPCCAQAWAELVGSVGSKDCNRLKPRKGFSS